MKIHTMENLEVISNSSKLDISNQISHWEKNLPEGMVYSKIPMDGGEQELEGIATTSKPNPDDKHRAYPVYDHEEIDNHVLEVSFEAKVDGDQLKEGEWISLATFTTCLDNSWSDVIGVNIGSDHTLHVGPVSENLPVTSLVKEEFKVTFGVWRKYSILLDMINEFYSLYVIDYSLVSPVSVLIDSGTFTGRGQYITKSHFGLYCSGSIRKMSVSNKNIKFNYMDLG